MQTTRDSFALGTGGIGIGTTVQKPRTNQILHYEIDGRAFVKASTDDLWTLAGTALAANENCVFWLYLDSAGTATVSQSAIKKASTATSGYVAGMFEWPQVANKCVVGAVLVKSGGSTFTPGTTSLASVATYVNPGADYGLGIAY